MPRPRSKSGVGGPNESATRSLDAKRGLHLLGPSSNLVLVPRRFFPCFVLAPLLSTAGCGSDNSAAATNVQGNYTIAVTNGQDTCGFQNWTEGQSTSAIPVTLTQNGNHVTADVQGAQGAYLMLLLGSATFTGSASGSSLTLQLRGTRSFTSGSCAYTIVATLTGTIQGDALQGAIQYTRDANSSPDCTSLTGCSATQQFNGTRPPSGAQ